MLLPLGRGGRTGRLWLEAESHILLSMLLHELISSPDEIDEVDSMGARGAGIDEVPGVGASVACARGTAAFLGLKREVIASLEVRRLRGASAGAAAGASAAAKGANREVRRLRGSAAAGASASAGGAAADGRRALPMNPLTEGRDDETLVRLGRPPTEDLLRPLSLTPLIDSLRLERLARPAFAFALSSSSSSRSRSMSISSTCLN